MDRLVPSMNIPRPRLTWTSMAVEVLITFTCLSWCTIRFPNWRRRTSLDTALEGRLTSTTTTINMRSPIWRGPNFGNRILLCRWILGRNGGIRRLKECLRSCSTSPLRKINMNGRALMKGWVISLKALIGWRTSAVRRRIACSSLAWRVVGCRRGRHDPT